MGTPVNSTDSLISQKRKTTKIPNYGSNGSAMSVNASIASGYQSLNKNENDLRDHQYDYLWKVSASRTVLDFESFWLKISEFLLHSILSLFVLVIAMLAKALS